MLPPESTPGTDLPVRSVLPALRSALETAGCAVLVAPPGTGKTTLVPLALAGQVAGRVVVAEPRRVAARAAASRMAALLGERVGDSVGYTVRGDRRVGPDTRVEVVTTGVLVQRMQRDAELPGTDAVVIDECHERHLDTDLALAFGVDIRAALRPGLVLVATSATAQSDRLAAALGGAPVVEATSALHDVEVRWRPPAGRVDPPLGLRVDPRFLDHVAAVVREALAGHTGDVLVFLPGEAEIRSLGARLRGSGADVTALHGRLPPAHQDAVLRPATSRRVVLASAVAESSLTVPGVRTVVDAGLSRVPRTDLARGLGSLVTVTASRAAATQRAGRAGREAPGQAYRCWSAAEHDRRPAHPEPEVATADLTSFMLSLARWGAPTGRGLALLDPPPPAAAEVALATLRGLGAVDDEGRATPRGRELGDVGAHPRLARALVDGAARVGTRRAAEVVALLSDEGPTSGDDLVALWRSRRDGRDRSASARWREEVRRLSASLGREAGPGDAVPDDLAAGLVVALAFPERIARQRREGGRTYLMAGGTAAELPEGSGLTGAGWLAVAVADRPPGRRDARVRVAAAIDEATAREAGERLVATRDEVVWREGDVRARSVERLGAIVLSERRLASPDPAAVTEALREGVRREGLGLLRWTPAAQAVRARLAACHAGLGGDWPEVGDEALLGRIDLSTARSRADLRRIDVVRALRALLPWDLAGRLDEVAPEHVEVPSGSRVRVDYSDAEAPVLPVRVQEVFGWTRAPVVAGRPLLLHLLSPAGRPVAVTDNLESFWRNGYPGVRADLRGRYPRHPWPQDPTAAEPTRRANRRR